MATNLVISFPDIPEAAIATTSSATGATDFDPANLARGPRYLGFKRAAAGSSLTITYDLGSATTKSIDHLVIARADKLVSGGVTQVDVDRSTNGSSWTNEYTDSSFASATLRGPASEDYLEEISTSSAYRYWRITYTATNTTFPHSKVNFGTLFDPGADPVAINTSRDLGALEFTAKDGTRWKSINREPLYRLSIVWEGLTDAKTEEFIDAAVHRHKRYCFLYAKSNTAALSGNKMLHCEIEQNSIQVEKIFNDYNLVAARFLELRN